MNNIKNRMIFSQALFTTVVLLWALLGCYNSCYEAPDTNALETLSLLYWSALLSAANSCASGSHIQWTKQKWMLQTASMNIGLMVTSISFDYVCALSWLAIVGMFVETDFLLADGVVMVYFSWAPRAESTAQPSWARSKPLRINETFLVNSVGFGSGPVGTEESSIERATLKPRDLDSHSPSTNSKLQTADTGSNRHE